MANPTWPSTLPAPQANSSAAYAAASNVVRSDVDAGVAMVRRKFTAVATPFGCQLKLSTAQWATLESFYRDVLDDAMPFDWTDWRTGNTATYRFIQRPSAAYIDGSVDRWLATLQLELMP